MNVTGVAMSYKLSCGPQFIGMKLSQRLSTPWSSTLPDCWMNSTSRKGSPFLLGWEQQMN